MKGKLITLSDLNEELLNRIAEVISKGDSEEKQLSLSFDVCESLNKLLEALKKARAKEIKESMNYLLANSEATGFITQMNILSFFTNQHLYMISVK